jgi:hypothetical protein
MTAPALTITLRSVEMYSMYEALAREKVGAGRDAEQRRVAREAAAARRWHRVAVRARRAQRRHAMRAV